MYSVLCTHTFTQIKYNSEFRNLKFFERLIGWLVMEAKFTLNEYEEHFAFDSIN